MNHFYENITGWTDEGLFSVYSMAVVATPDNGHVVEIGSWKGRSAAYMAVEIINSGKNIKFDCVDPWTGTSDEEHGFDEDYRKKTLFEAFTKNMEPVAGHYNAIKLPSVEASKLYEDESLDFVFIDGDHSYEAVQADIKAWLPKVKPGGCLAGHDWPWEPLRRAVCDIFPPEDILLSSDKRNTCWLYLKN